MTTVSIIYFSGTGHTTKLAEAVNKGSASVEGVKTNLIAIRGEDITKGRYANETVLAQLGASNAMILGSPTYMGGPAAQFKAFADATSERWYRGMWRDKVAAGFTVSSGPSGDKLSTLHYFFTLAMQQGMVWVGFPETPMNDKGINRLSSYSGVMAHAPVHNSVYSPFALAPKESECAWGAVERGAAVTVPTHPPWRQQISNRFHNDSDKTAMEHQMNKGEIRLRSEKSVHFLLFDLVHGERTKEIKL